MSWTPYTYYHLAGSLIKPTEGSFTLPVWVECNTLPAQGQHLFTSKEYTSTKCSDCDAKVPLIGVKFSGDQGCQQIVGTLFFVNKNKGRRALHKIEKFVN